MIDYELVYLNDDDDDMGWYDDSQELQSQIVLFNTTLEYLIEEFGENSVNVREFLEGNM